MCLNCNGNAEFLHLLSQHIQIMYLDVYVYVYVSILGCYENNTKLRNLAT